MALSQRHQGVRRRLAGTQGTQEPAFLASRENGGHRRRGRGASESPAKGGNPARLVSGVPIAQFSSPRASFLSCRASLLDHTPVASSRRPHCAETAMQPDASFRFGDDETPADPNEDWSLIVSDEDDAAVAPIEP